MRSDLLLLSAAAARDPVLGLRANHHQVAKLTTRADGASFERTDGNGGRHCSPDAIVPHREPASLGGVTSPRVRARESRETSSSPARATSGPSSSHNLASETTGGGNVRRVLHALGGPVASRLRALARCLSWKREGAASRQLTATFVARSRALGTLPVETCETSRDLVFVWACSRPPLGCRFWISLKVIDRRRELSINCDGARR